MTVGSAIGIAVEAGASSTSGVAMSAVLYTVSGWDQPGAQGDPMLVLSCRLGDCRAVDRPSPNASPERSTDSLADDSN